MTPEQLGTELKRMYDNAPDGDLSTMVRLFGIMYAEELNNCGAPRTEIATIAFGKPAYHAEISKGKRLARYVVPNESTKRMFPK